MWQHRFIKHASSYSLDEMTDLCAIIGWKRPWTAPPSKRVSSAPCFEPCWKTFLFLHCRLALSNEEFAVLKPRLVVHCKNAESWGYSDSQKRRGVAVCKQTRTETRPGEYFLHVFRFGDESLKTGLPGGYMNGLMKLRTCSRPSCGHGTRPAMKCAGSRQRSWSA